MVVFTEFCVWEILWFVGMLLDESKLIFSTGSLIILFPPGLHIWEWHGTEDEGQSKGHIVLSYMPKGGWYSSRLAWGALRTVTRHLIPLVCQNHSQAVAFSWGAFLGSSKDSVVVISNKDPKLKLLVCIWPLLFPSTLFQGHPDQSLALGVSLLTVSPASGYQRKRTSQSAH